MISLNNTNKDVRRRVIDIINSSGLGGVSLKMLHKELFNNSVETFEDSRSLSKVINDLLAKGDISLDDEDGKWISI